MKFWKLSGNLVFARKYSTFSDRIPVDMESNAQLLRYIFRMKKTITYRLVSFLLAFVFCLFNVGLPIVVASCPMTKTKVSSCCREGSSTTGAALNSLKNTDCCKTTIAAERNKTEFLQGKGSVASIEYSITPLLQFIVAPQIDASIPIALYSPPSLASKDIPLFTSVLLI